MGITSTAEPSEAHRLAILRDLLVLDSEPEEVFDSIARMASQTCGAPIALISLIDEERQWFKANVGLPGVNETPRDVAFCAHAIQDDHVFQVADACADDRFRENPLVTGNPNIRFYAGAPLGVAGGARIGTLCVIDHQPRQLTAAQIETLASLATIAAQALTMRRDLINKSLAVRSEYEQALAVSEARHRALIEDQTEFVSLFSETGELAYTNPAYARRFGRTPQDMVGTNIFDHIEPHDAGRVRTAIAEVVRTGSMRTGETRLVDPHGDVRWLSWTNTLQRDAEGRALVHAVGRDITDRKRAEDALDASRQFLYRTGQVAGVGGWQLDLRTSAITWSEQTRRIHEVDDAYEPELESAIAFYAPESRPLIHDAVQRGIREGRSWDIELRFITAKGRHIWVRSVGEVEFENGKPVRLIGAFQDVTDRKDLEQSVERQAATLRAVIESIPANVTIVDRHCVLQFANSNFERWCGSSRDKIVGKPLVKVFGAVEYERSRPWIERVIAGETVNFEKEYVGQKRNAHLAITYVPLWNENGGVNGFIQIASDISRHRQEEGRLLELSQRDALTGLLNRAGFESYMTRKVKAGESEGLAMLCIDLDHFKPVNDRHGHPTGDKLLQQFAKRLSELVRPTDAVVRLGGDEFAVVLAGVAEARHASIVADKVIAVANAPFQIDALRLSIGASVGIAWGLSHTEPWSALLDRADQMLYQAKGAGRGCQAMCGDSLEPKLADERCGESFDATLPATSLSGFTLHAANA